MEALHLAHYHNVLPGYGFVFTTARYIRAIPSGGPSLSSKQAGHFGHPASKIVSGLSTKFVFRDGVVLAPQGGTYPGRGLAVAHDDHVLAQERRLNGADGQFLATITGRPDGQYTRDLVSQQEPA